MISPYEMLTGIFFQFNQLCLFQSLCVPDSLIQYLDVDTPDSQILECGDQPLQNSIVMWEEIFDLYWASFSIRYVDKSNLSGIQRLSENQFDWMFHYVWDKADQLWLFSLQSILPWDRFFFVTFSGNENIRLQPKRPD